MGMPRDCPKQMFPAPGECYVSARTSRQAPELTSPCLAMGLHLLLLLLLLLQGLADQGLAGSPPEMLQAPVGSSILVQCHYQLQDLKARKVWCRLLPEGCQPLVSSAVDRGAPGGRRAFLTDLGDGVLQVEMVSLREEDAGEYWCMVESTTGPQTMHRVALEVIPAVSGLKEKGEEEEAEEETSGVGSASEASSSDTVSHASPSEPGQSEKSMPLIWGAVVLLGLLLVAAVLFAVTAKRRGWTQETELVFLGFAPKGVGAERDLLGLICLLLLQAPSAVVHHISDSGLAVDLPSDVPYVKLDSPPFFDNATYSSLPLDPPSGKPAPAPSSLPPLPPEAPDYTKSVTYATVIFPGGAKGGGAPSEPVQDPPNSQTLPS
ncbi:Trem-like transcript 1 protein [Galemys pyrenaicus]|uniref:Trem-like transcript 1 protein n=1 Tax=Galemys pyrenaicus TaxID=202257 RepID=A0A8J5ZY52_GALPY|nr:Trem-like transcript 1 protein [Galemys pyrenaicus]